jgi:hypothetical protein
MRYTVTWKHEAEETLTRIWTEASDRQAITRAAHQIDRRLAADPDNVGESRNAGRRILIVRPLVAIYRVSHSDRLVQVLALWKF